LAPVDNPKDLPDADKDDAVILAVMRDGTIFLGMEKINVPDITRRVTDMITGRLDKTVFVKADARAQYGNVVKVVDEVRSAGVDNIGLLTEKSRDAKAKAEGEGGS
ncbi:MAG: ExbD/TolR family protein, partial [Candidatus Acidiferrales bacterium]